MISRRATLVLALVAAPACGSCDDDVLAVVESTEGHVERDTAAARGQWATAEIGDELRLGDRLRTGRSARLRLVPDGEIAVGPDTTLRLSDTPPESRASGRVVLEAGEAIITTADSAYELGVGDSVLHVDPSARVELSQQEGGFRIELISGRARVRRPDGGEPDELSPRDARSVGASVAQRDPSPAVDADEGAARAAGPLTAVVTGGGAEVREAEGHVRALVPGRQSLAAPSALRLQGGTTVELSRGDQVAFIEGPASVIVGDASGALVRTTSGRVTARGTGGPVRVAVPGGVIILRGAGETRVGVGSDRVATVTPRLGEAEVRGNGRATTLRAGESATLSAEGAVERIADGAPTSADLTLVAGASVTIHDPAAPTNVRLELGDACAGEGTLELGAPGGTFDRVRRPAEGSAIVALAAGRHAYRITCGAAGGRGVSGRISIENDAGIRPLPQSAQRVSVDADGRQYTVVYQNRLPTVSFRWPGASPVGPYTLTIASGGRSVQRRGPRPTQTIRSGGLPEGTHRFTFESADGRRSRAGTLSIRFAGGAANTAYLTSPDDGAPRRGDTVVVSGGALRDSTVSIVGGGPLEVDAQGRFHASITAPTRDDALAVRVVHRSAGTHIFLRRYAGAPAP